MRTSRFSGHLSCTHAPPPPCHTCCPAMHTPCHAHPLPYTHPYHTPPCHTHPTTHAPCHTCPPCHPSPCMPPSFAMHFPFTMHTPPLSHMPPPHLWTDGMIHACENITFPQLLLRAVININLNLNTLLVSWFNVFSMLFSERIRLLRWKWWKRWRWDIFYTNTYVSISIFFVTKLEADICNKFTPSSLNSHL